jgi:hypothetical protein
MNEVRTEWNWDLIAHKYWKPVIQKIVNKKRFAVLKYDSCWNLGDNIQTLAAMKFLGTDDVSFVDREKLNTYSGPPVRLIMNGWFMINCKNFPPTENIEPIFIGFHCGNENLISENVSYFKKWEPIGCRDSNTVSLCEKYGIKAWLSYCLTLGFDEYNGERDGEYEIDLNRIDISDHVVDKKYWGDNEYKLALSQSVIDKYKKAKYVKTGRLHCWLPCLAMGTPTELIYNYKNSDSRFSGYLEKLNIPEIKRDLKLFFKQIK